jgi:hypothetical protein
VLKAVLLELLYDDRPCRVGHERLAEQTERDDFVVGMGPFRRGWTGSARTCDLAVKLETLHWRRQGRGYDDMGQGAGFRLGNNTCYPWIGIGGRTSNHRFRRWAKNMRVVESQPREFRSRLHLGRRLLVGEKSAKATSQHGAAVGYLVHDPELL